MFLLQIDMDTIETSNLNRQFLFRKRHIGESKAVVAAKAVQNFKPSAKIVAHQASTRIWCSGRSTIYRVCSSLDHAFVQAMLCREKKSTMKLNMY